MELSSIYVSHFKYQCEVEEVRGDDSAALLPRCVCSVPEIKITHGRLLCAETFHEKVTKSKLLSSTRQVKAAGAVNTPEFLLLPTNLVTEETEIRLHRRCCPSPRREACAPVCEL